MLNTPLSGGRSYFSVGSITGFCTVLLVMLTLCFCGLLWLLWHSVNKYKLFFPLSRYIQYCVLHSDWTCSSVSWGQVPVPAASFQKSSFALLLIDGNWQLHLFPDQSLILHSQESAKKGVRLFWFIYGESLKRRWNRCKGLSL